MTARQVLARVGRFLRRDVSGAGAVEFAVVAPILLTLLFGGSELGVALTIDRKVKAAAGAAVDLASQSTKLEDADFRKLMGIARGTLAPYSVGALQMRLTQIAITKTGQGLVDWSCATSGYEKQAPGTPVTLPPEFSTVAKSLLEKLLLENGLGSNPVIYVVRGESRYDFKPVTGQVFTGNITLSGVTYVQPRYSDRVDSDSKGCATFSL